MWQLPLKVKLPFFSMIGEERYGPSPDEVGLFLRQGEAIITKRIRLKAPVCKPTCLFSQHCYEQEGTDQLILQGLQPLSRCLKHSTLQNLPCQHDSIPKTVTDCAINAVFSRWLS